MLTSISPVGEAGRGQRWTITVTVFTLASLAAGTLLGGALGLIGARIAASPLVGAWSPAIAAVVLAAIAVMGASVDAGRLSFTVPSWQRQVDERWLTSFRGWVYGAGFGAQLGAAVLTVVPTAATYVAFSAALLVAGVSGQAVAGAAIGATFGLGRAIPVLATIRWRDPEQLRTSFRRFDAGRAQASTVTVAGQLVVAAGAVALVPFVVS